MCMECQDLPGRYRFIITPFYKLLIGRWQFDIEMLLTHFVSEGDLGDCGIKMDTVQRLGPCNFQVSQLGSLLTRFSCLFPWTMKIEAHFTGSNEQEISCF